MRRASYQYDPYDNITSMDGDMAESNPYRFSSEHHDEDLDLVYYNYRHYNPTDGRWISRDPIAEEGGVNLYGFVANSPIEAVDYLGAKITITRRLFRAIDPDDPYTSHFPLHFSSFNHMKNDAQDYKKFAVKVKDALQKLLEKNCGTLRLVEHEENFPFINNRGSIVARGRNKEYHLVLDPPADLEKSQNQAVAYIMIFKICFPIS